MVDYKIILIFIILGSVSSQIIRMLGLDITIYYSFAIGVIVGLVMAIIKQEYKEENK